MGTERLRRAPNHKAMPLPEVLYALFVLLQGHGAAEGRKEHHGGVGLLQRLCSFGTEHYRDCATAELNNTETVLLRN